ncbi:MAG TPA: hypothetical protein PK156_33985, partial [Polyangium sp.]|nr:hypothetical protein [Polyangium sp.]
MRRAFGTILATLGLTSVFACSVLISLGLHVNLPPLRRITRHAVNQVLAGALEGRVVIEDFDQVKLDEIVIKAVVAFDPVGRQTIRASGIKAQIDTRGLLRAARNGNVRILLPLIQIDDVDLNLDRDDQGRLGIQQAFTPKPSKSPTKKPSKPKARPSQTFILLDRVEVAHARTHGNITSPRNLDAETTNLVASLHIDPDKLELDVEPTNVTERGLLPVEIAGNGEYHLHVDFPPANTPPETTAQVLPRMATGFSGKAGNIAVTVKASLEGDVLSASVDLPKAEAADITKLVPGAPIVQRTSLRAAIDGAFPTFTIDGQLDFTPTEGLPAQVQVVGKLDLQGGPNIVVDVNTTNLNARAFREDLPATSVDARAHLAFSAVPEPRFVAEATVEPSKVGDQSVPAIDAHAVYDHGLLEGRVTLHEEGAPTRGAFVLEGRDTVRFETDTSVASLRTIPRLAMPISGSGRVKVRGAVRGGKELDARVEGNVQSFATNGGVSLENGRFDGRVRGPFDHLEVNAIVTGNQLRAGENSADRVTVRATGPILSPLVNAHLEGGDVEDLRATALIDPKSKSVRNVKVRLARGGEELRGQVAEIRADGGIVKAQGLALEGPGLGSLGGTLVVANQDITGKLVGKNIDLERIARMLGLGKRTRGIADVDIAITRTHRGRQGHVDVQVKDATLAPMPGIEFPGAFAAVKATFDNEKATLEASLRIDDHAKPGEDPATACEGTIAEVRVSEAEGDLKGPLLAASTWKKLTGRARVEAKDTRIDCLAKRLPLALLLTEVGGRLDAGIAVERPKGQRFVSVKEFEVQTRGLKIAGPVMFGEDKPRWESRSLDIALAGSVDGATGATNTKVTLRDDKVVAEVDASAKLDLATLVDDPKRRVTSLANSEGAVTLSIPRRSVDSLKCLPSVFHDKLPPFEGDFAVTVTGKGTVLDPNIGARISGWQLSHVGASREPTEWSLPVDVDVIANYKAKKAGVVTQIRRNSREIASIVGNSDVDLQALAEGVEYTPNFDVQTTLTRLPLGRLPFFSARGVNAQVSGTFQIGQHGTQHTAKARLILPKVRINDEPALERVGLSLDVGPSTDDVGSSHGAFEIELHGKEGGQINVAGYSGVDWSEFTPKVKDDKPAGLSIRAHDFELASLQPLVTGAFSRIGGKLDGDLNVASTMYGDESRGYVESNMRLEHGVIHIPQIGQELKNARFSLSSHEHGALHFDDIQAEGISGRIKGSAVAKMKGLAFQSATATFSIAKSESLPITFEGVPLGHAYGKLDIVAEKQPHEMRVLVKIPALNLALP